MYQHIFYVSTHNEEIVGGREGDGMDAESGVGTDGAGW